MPITSGEGARKHMLGRNVCDFHLVPCIGTNLSRVRTRGKQPNVALRWIRNLGLFKKQNAAPMAPHYVSAECENKAETPTLIETFSTHCCAGNQAQPMYVMDVRTESPQHNGTKLSMRAQCFSSSLQSPILGTAAQNLSLLDD